MSTTPPSRPEWASDSGVLKTREEFVTAKLREAILRGHLKPGEKLEQNELAELLNVSRSPVRAAMLTLAAEGLVVVQPHRGFTVAELSADELEEIYFLRGILEGMAARLAAPNLDSQRLAKLRQILGKLDQTVDLDEWLYFNRQFHNTIYEAARRPRLLSLIENLRNTSAPYIRQYLASEEHLESARIGHRRILQACETRDSLCAQKETERHHQSVYEAVRGLKPSAVNT